MLPKAINTPKRGSKFSDLYILVVVCKEEEKKVSVTPTKNLLGLMRNHSKLLQIIAISNLP